MGSVDSFLHRRDVRLVGAGLLLLPVLDVVRDNPATLDAYSYSELTAVLLPLLAVAALLWSVFHPRHRGGTDTRTRIEDGG
jgi:hypothetical protein